MKKRLLCLLAAVAITLSLSACQSGNASQPIEITAETNLLVQTEAKSLITSSEKSVHLPNNGNSPNTVLSREYEFDLEKYLDNYDKDGIYSLRNELNFLSEEQYEIYIRALIFIDKIEYFIIPDTCETQTHFLDSNGETHKNLYTKDLEGYTVSPYIYVSTYQSFYEYLQSVFTQEAVDRIMADERFRIVNGELYYNWGEKGGPIYFQSGQYQLTEKNDDEVIFEYIAIQANDENEWTETHTIKLVHVENGWRSELFEYLKAESQF